jgi:uncharacterized protein YukE
MSDDSSFQMSEYEEKVRELLVVFEKNRDSIMEMISDLEKLKNKLDTIFPETADARYMRFFEEKVKAVSSFFNVLLDMRKEINKSLKDEIEMRRRVEGKDAEVDLESLLDVRAATRKIEDFKDASDRMKKKRIKNIKEMELPENVTVPGINARTEGV